MAGFIHTTYLLIGCIEGSFQSSRIEGTLSLASSRHWRCSSQKTLTRPFFSNAQPRVFWLLLAGGHCRVAVRCSLLATHYRLLAADNWRLTFSLLTSTVCLGSTHNLRLWKLLKQLNPLGMTLKVVRVTEIILLCGAQYSFVILRLNKVKLLRQSVEKWICMGK